MLVDKVVLYQVSMSIVGASLAVNGLQTLRGGSMSISAGLLVVGGVGLVVSTGYQLATGSRPEPLPTWTVWVAVLAAAMSAAGTALFLLS
ncbi:hypothetical protein [Haloferax larsenii]|uniref:Uncharacterized protein n=1 Tax=Haloferax larsenii TaxID=302484 RepID=A0A1H7RGT0_HALLR|nr:hypothetical protein [Haloferax larsenii]SEL59208.1 hypothetical protein SAMN04488691_10621 [Haloferax larsenii]